ncbi:MAG TPA: hypothetical protein VNU93_05465 [Verrucomicrobiae bacterium]|nr:hypothetical protein [Verrucomicrobiae bacterium]
MEQPHVKVADQITKDWEFVCRGCGRIAFSMASASKALFCRNCNSDLVPIWLPLNVPRYAVPAKVSAECPYCFASLVVTLPPGKVPLGKTKFSCRHCLGELTVNFRKTPIAIKKARQGK